MQLVIRFLAAIALAFAWVGAASAVESTKAEDLECLTLMGSLQTSADPQTKSTGVSGAFYFMGKLVATNPNIDLAREVTAEISRLRGQPAGAALQRCLNELNSRARELVASSDRPASTN